MTIIITLFVDDGLIAGNNVKEMYEVLNKLNSYFEITYEEKITKLIVILRYGNQSSLRRDFCESTQLHKENSASFWIRFFESGLYADGMWNVDRRRKFHE